MKYLTMGLGFIALLIIGSFYNIVVTGYVGMKLWAWFVVPIFHLPELTLAYSYGISLLATLWTKQIPSPTNDSDVPESTKIGTFFGTLLLPWVILFLGWIVTLFM